MDVTEFGGKVNTSSMEYGLPRSLPGVNSFFSVKIGKKEGKKHQHWTQDPNLVIKKLERFVISLVQSLTEGILSIICKLACCIRFMESNTHHHWLIQLALYF